LRLSARPNAAGGTGREFEVRLGLRSVQWAWAWEQGATVLFCTARARALYMKADRRGKQGHRQAMYGREKSYSTCTGRKGMCVRSAPARGLNRYSTVPTSLAAENWMHHDHTIEATLAIVAVHGGQETRWEQGPARQPSPPLPFTDPAPDDIALHCIALHCFADGSTKRTECTGLIISAGSTLS
jgi:hypothetical protein